ncbi:MAG TPA: hypothetical protein VEP49_21075 [Acidimicrobiia bacterium]|nr:hypothetical protein [Acidimicrobiia bacterium]
MDGFVVAVAGLAGGAVVATVDTRDMDRLAHTASVVIAGIGRT